MIVVRNVAKIFASDCGPVTAVCNVDFAVNDRDFAVIVGPCGSGKTTLLNLMAGLTLPSAGQVLYYGVEVWRLPDQEQALFRNLHVGFVFQYPSLMPSLSVLENVLLPTTFLGAGLDAGERTRCAMALLVDVGLGHYMGSYPRQLDAVRQQRLVIARALANQPRVLYVDEPASELDASGEQEIMALLEDVHRRLGLAIVVATRNSQLVRFATRSFRMASGQLVEDRIPKVAV